MSNNLFMGFAFVAFFLVLFHLPGLIAYLVVYRGHSWINPVLYILALCLMFAIGWFTPWSLEP